MATSQSTVIGMAEAKNNLSALAAQANAAGVSFVVTKNRKPYLELRPLAVKPRPESEVTITPVRRRVEVADIDDLFEGYEGGFVPREDGFASAAGEEAM